MKIYRYPKKEEWADLLKRPTFDTSDLNRKVQRVLNDIKSIGDRAVAQYAEMYDGFGDEDFRVKEEEFVQANQTMDEELKQAIEVAANNIHQFHASQKMETKVVETMPGVKCWQKSVGIEKVGLYIPGGTAPLFSSVLMLAIPAKIAGCKEIVLCTPPGKEGRIHPAILFAAQLSGITKVFKVGGVQAIGAMAYGTQSVPKVYKIFGPGNQYVTAAKQLVSIADVSIDMPAGPSEVEVLADESANPAFVAADLLSQAEHGVDSQAVLITNSPELIPAVEKEVAQQLEVLPRKEMAAKSLENSRIILLNSREELIEITNEYAPEHLIISMQNYMEIGDQIVNAGSIFLGNYTPESAGDYASGTNHTLPTNGWARSYSGVNLDSFIRKITFQEISKEGIQALAPTIEKMAEAESLTAHKNAAKLRRQ